ncbi:TlpA family protein disulfide reductase [Bremerella alba]|nr:TlpA disulfide reductase family protein [Bremerella alba]
MKRTVLSTCIVLSLFSFMACGRAAEDNPQSSADAPKGEVLAKDSLQTFIDDSTNTQPLMDFANANFEALMKEMSQAGDVAQTHIDGIRESLANVDPGENEQAAGLLNSIDRSLEMFEFRLLAKGLTLDEVKAKVTDSPNDVEAISLYATKIGMVLSEDLVGNIEKMESQVETEADFIVSSAENAEASEVKIAYQKAAVVLQSAAQEIERLKAYEKIVGEPMKPIDAEAWVNGDGFTSEELKGKVILLDFWAVWCGPCVASFPHLVEWQEKYGDEGLQIIGITRYFNFDWPEGAEGPGQAEGEVPPAQEQAMLDKFTAEFELKHPTALVADPDEFYSYYAVSAIPHFVLIGRDGKIHKVSGGISESRAKALEEEIKKLLAEPAPE